MSKKPSDDKKSKKAPKGKPSKGNPKPETSTKASPPKKAKKGAREVDAPETEASAPTPAPPAAAPQSPPADEPLHAGRQSTQSTTSVLTDDPARWIDGKSLHEKGKYLLNVCPKAKDSPAESCIALRGQVAAATDERSCFWVDLGCTICESPLKVTRASFDAFMALLDGELKAAEKLEASVIVRWDGLVATIRREGESDERAVTLDRFESGPAAEHFFLDAPEFAVGSHATVTIERLRNAATWKGDGTAHIFVSPTSRQVWIQYDVGGSTFARAILAFEGSNLGVRNPTLPMDMGGNKAAPAAAPEKPAGAVEAPAPVTDLREALGPVFQIGPGMAWCMVQIDYSAAWERLRAAEVNDLSPFVADDVRRVVTWGPYPRERARARLRYIVMRLSALHCDPRLVPCDAPDLMARALGSGEPTALGQLGDGTIDVEFEEAPFGMLGAGGEGGGPGSEPTAAPAFPTPTNDTSVSIDGDAWEGLTDEQRAELEGLTEWDAEHTSETLIPEEASLLAAAMERMGLGCLNVEQVDEGDGPLTFWTVGRRKEEGDKGTVDGAAAALPDFPPPGPLPVVVEVPSEIWDALSPDAIEALHFADKAVIDWYTGQESHSSRMMQADHAAIIGEVLSGLGFRAVDVAEVGRFGSQVTRWLVGPKGETNGAAS